MILGNAVKQSAQWYAVYTRPRAEKKLYSLLTQQNVECFLPLRKKRSQRSDRRKWVHLPLMPSYLFVHITEKDHYKVLNTPGAICYVSVGGKAASISGEKIHHLYNLLANGQDVEVHKGEIEEGDQVELRCGPLKGVKGEVVQIRNKQHLLLRFGSLGYGVHVEIAMDELKPAVTNLHRQEA
jgi:transcriptional antiterminator RfaH